MVAQSEIEKIREIATEFRNAIDFLVLNKPDIIPKIPFGRFPNGCCGDTTILLNTYFKELGYKNTVWVGGQKKKVVVSHAWLKVQNICVDITADQFADLGFPKVIVTSENEYPLKNIFVRNMMTSSPVVDMPHLHAMYRLIKSQLELS